MSISDAASDPRTSQAAASASPQSRRDEPATPRAARPSQTRPVGAAEPPDASRGAAAYLARIREGWTRLTPQEAYAAQQAGAVIIDTRTAEQRAESAHIPGAFVIDRTVLEWRLDPSNDWRIPEATSWQTRYVVICRHGFSSSVAARALQDVGLVNATDVIGGYAAWVEAGLPTTHEPADVRF